MFRVGTSDSESLARYHLVVIQCFRALEALSEQNEVVLIWVPGHSGMLGNDLTDELTRNGSGSKFIRLEPAIAKHAGSFKVQVKKDTEDIHQRRWECLTNCWRARNFWGAAL